MSLLRRIFRLEQWFTPEEIGVWLIDEQRGLCAKAQDALHAPPPSMIDVPAIQIDGEAVLHMFIEAYVFQLALVCVTFKELLDDRRVFQDSSPKKYDLTKFIWRIHAAAQEIARPYLIVKNDQFQRDMLPMVPPAMKFEAIEGHILRYYAVTMQNCNENATLFPQSAGFTAHLRSQGSYGTSIKAGVDWSYSEAFRRFLPNAEFSSNGQHSNAEGAILLRTQIPWYDHFLHFQLRLCKRFEERRLKVL